MPIIDPEYLGGGYYTDPRYALNGPDPNPRVPGQQPPETGGPMKQSSDQRAAGMLTPQQQAVYESLLAQVQSASGGYFNPRIGVALARGLQNGMSPELIMQQVGQYLDAEGGGASGYDRGYNAFAVNHDGGQNLLNRLALGYWGNRRDAYGGPITQPGTYGNGEPGGGVPYDGPHTYDPTGGTRPGRGGPAPTGDGGTRGGGYGAPTGTGSGGSYGYDPTGGGRGDRGSGGSTGSGPLIEDRQPIGGYGNPSAAALRGGGGGRFQQAPQGYAGAYGQQQAQAQPRTVTVRYDYGGGTQSQGGAQQRQQPSAQPPQQTQQPQMGYRPPMHQTAPTGGMGQQQPRYISPQAQRAQNTQGPQGMSQGPQGYAQGYQGAQNGWSRWK